MSTYDLPSDIKKVRLTMAPVPMIDHYYGRSVEGIEETEDGGWALLIEGGVRIINLNADYDQPDDLLIGTKLSAGDLSSDMTKLWFGTDDNPRQTVMLLDPAAYLISDPNYNDGDPINPQMAPPEMTTPFEMSAPGDRVVDGAEEPQEATAESESVEGA